MSTRLTNIENAKYSLRGAQLCDDLLVGNSLSTDGLVLIYRRKFTDMGRVAQSV